MYILTKKLTLQKKNLNAKYKMNRTFTLTRTKNYVYFNIKIYINLYTYGRNFVNLHIFNLIDVGDFGVECLKLIHFSIFQNIHN